MKMQICNPFHYKRNGMRRAGTWCRKVLSDPVSWSISDVLWNHLCDEQDAEFLTNLAYIYYDIGNYDNACQFFKGHWK